ncbi:alpha-E domain-containing protein [Bythopirellula polymerisocia]|uniref:DUF403 domain-containing protein n=1 Tax=Bythopirellula polymerisocia TaxID=2528003 RepID=A0A5C6CNB6_9BACT|nr:alpha-E domain-containing protein [Bythopirellula polymerisocia]TWU24546.1 hypothetical protein Pla144_34300 [Bythopirellula polymerisocia]
MLSRVADSIYWMSRYVERAENLARFVDVTHNMSLDLPRGSEQQWGALVYASGDQEYFEKHYGKPTRENVTQFLTFDPEYSGSILSCVQAARENARSVRESISSEMWEQLNQFYLTVCDAARAGLPESPNDFYLHVKNSSHLFVGITVTTFSQGEAWHFSRLGRVLERADKTSRILDVKYFTLLPSVADVGTPIDDLQWSAVLRSVSGFEMFRRRHHGITPKRVVGFLVLDRQFPRAIMHCVDTAFRSLHSISGSPQGTFWNIAEKQLGQLRSELAYSTVDEIIAIGLHEFLDSLQTKLNDIGGGIHQSFIAMNPDGQAKPSITTEA